MPQESLPCQRPRQARDGKSHHYWVLVESYRTARGPRQHQIAYLGKMDEAVQQAAQHHPAHQTSLLETTTAEWVEINVNAVRAERSHQFGDVWLALELIKKLQLTDVVLPTRKGVDLHLRCVSTPEPDLAMLLQKLKLKPPARLAPNPNL